MIHFLGPQDGEDVYSCSPFHVRFGKLQVLRAGEKRVSPAFATPSYITQSSYRM